NIFNGRVGEFDDALVTVYETRGLIGLSDAVRLPALECVFEDIFSRLDGRPTQILVDEFHWLIDHDWFGQAIRRIAKYNAGFTLATQSLSEVAQSRNRSILVESCPINIYLPNPDATDELYKQFNLTDEEIQIIRTARPRHDYYCK